MPGAAVPGAAAAWRPCDRRPRCLHSAGMEAMLSGVVLVVAFGLVAIAGTALVVALYRVSGHRAEGS